MMHEEYVHTNSRGRLETDVTANLRDDSCIPEISDSADEKAFAVNCNGRRRNPTSGESFTG
jgi:hypothetical protein